LKTLNAVNNRLQTTLSANRAPMKPQNVDAPFKIESEMSKPSLFWELKLK
jgi:hypothetical protein